MNPRDPRFQPVWAHESVRASHQRRVRRASLETGWIDPALHYGSVRQGELWMDVHRAHAPLAVDPAFRDIFRQTAQDMVARLASGPVHVIGLGAGGGEKEAMVLEALSAAGFEVRYTPVDVGMELALCSAQTALPFVQRPIQPVVADLRSLPPDGEWLRADTAGEVRVVTAFGLLPNFLPSEIFPLLRGLLRPGDWLLVSANLAGIFSEGSRGEVPRSYREACVRILPQYDNGETARWLRQVLLEWGVDARLSPVVFGLESIEGVLAVSAGCEWLKTETFPWEERPLHVTAGGKVQLFFSLRYTPDLIMEKLAGVGLRAHASQLTPCRQEGVWSVCCHPQ